MSSQTPQPNSIPEEWLSAYLDDELDADQHRMVESAVAQNPQMAQLLQELRATRNLVQQLPSFPNTLKMRHPASANRANSDLQDGLDEVKQSSSPSNNSSTTSAASLSRKSTDGKRSMDDQVDSAQDAGLFQIGNWQMSHMRAIALAASVVGVAVVGSLMWYWGGGDGSGSLALAPDSWSTSKADQGLVDNEAGPSTMSARSTNSFAENAQRSLASGTPDPKDRAKFEAGSPSPSGASLAEAAPAFNFPPNVDAPMLSAPAPSVVAEPQSVQPGLESSLALRDANGIPGSDSKNLSAKKSPDQLSDLLAANEPFSIEKGSSTGANEIPNDPNLIPNIAGSVPSAMPPGMAQPAPAQALPREPNLPPGLSSEISSGLGSAQPPNPPASEIEDSKNQGATGIMPGLAGPGGNLAGDMADGFGGVAAPGSAGMPGGIGGGGIGGLSRGGMGGMGGGGMSRTVNPQGSLQPGGGRASSSPENTGANDKVMQFEPLPGGSGSPPKLDNPPSRSEKLKLNISESKSNESKKASTVSKAAIYHSNAWTDEEVLSQLESNALLRQINILRVKSDNERPNKSSQVTPTPATLAIVSLESQQRKAILQIAQQIGLNAAIQDDDQTSHAVFVSRSELDQLLQSYKSMPNASINPFVIKSSSDTNSDRCVLILNPK